MGGVPEEVEVVRGGRSEGFLSDLKESWGVENVNLIQSLLWIGRCGRIVHRRS